MLNQVIICGRLVDIEENTDTSLKLTIAVPRPYKNVDGIYENDNVACIVMNGTKEKMNSYIKKGDIMGIRGRVQVNDGQMIIIAEKVTFLSSHKKEEE